MTIWRRGAFLLSLMCLVLLLGCSKVTDSSQVIGTYEAHHQNGVETLQLRPDGTYIHHFKAVNGIALDTTRRSLGDSSARIHWGLWAATPTCTHMSGIAP